MCVSHPDRPIAAAAIAVAFTRTQVNTEQLDDQLMAPYLPQQKQHNSAAAASATAAAGDGALHSAVGQIQTASESLLVLRCVACASGVLCWQLVCVVAWLLRQQRLCQLWHVYMCMWLLH